MTHSTTNTAAREVGCDTRSDLAKGMHRAYLLGMRVADGDIEPEQALAQLTELAATLTQQQGGEQEAASGDAIRGLRDDEGMLSGAELESLIDAAQTTSDSKAVAFLGQVARDLLQQLHGVESVLLAVGKRPPLCDTKNAVRFAVGMPFDANGETE